MDNASKSYYYQTALGVSEGLMGDHIDSLLVDQGEEAFGDITILSSEKLVFLNFLCSKMPESDKTKYINKLKARRKADMAIISALFVQNEEEGYSDKVIVILGDYGDYVKTRLITATLVEQGMAPKNTRSLIDKLADSGLVEVKDSEEDGARFGLSKEGWIKRKLLLSRVEKSHEKGLGSHSDGVSESNQEKTNE